jgi:hypothetical protein
LARETALKKNATKANLAAVNVLSSRVLTDESVVNSDNEQAMRVATGTGTTEVPSQVASAQSEQSAASVCEAQASDIIKDGSFAGSITSLGAGGISGGRTLLKMLLDGPGEEAAADTAPETEGWSTLFYGAAILVVSLVGGISRAATC